MLEKILLSLKLRKALAPFPLVPRKCPLCLSQNNTLLIRQDRNFLGLRNVQCDGCGFVFTSPYLNDDDIGRFYESAYRENTKGKESPQEFLADRPWMAKRGQFFADQIVPLIRTSYLDFGCGEGSVPYAIRAHLPQIDMCLIEPNPNYLANSAQLCRAQGAQSLEGLPADKRFDVISMIHVLEHIGDPVSLLIKLRERLNPEGCLFIDVPDLGQYKTLSDFHIAHCLHFSVYTVEQTLLRAGFSIEKLEQHQPPHLPASINVIARRASNWTQLDRHAPSIIDPMAGYYSDKIRAISTNPLKFLLRRVTSKFG